jgi:hypothetical protein
VSPFHPLAYSILFIIVCLRILNNLNVNENTQETRREKARVILTIGDFPGISGEDTVLSDQPYRYLTVDEMKSLGDDSLPIDVTRDERIDNKMIHSTESAMSTSQPPTALEDSISPKHVSSQHETGKSVLDGVADNILIDRHPQHVG